MIPSFISFEPAREAQPLQKAQRRGAPQDPPHLHACQNPDARSCTACEPAERVGGDLFGFDQWIMPAAEPAIEETDQWQKRFPPQPSEAREIPAAKLFEDELGRIGGIAPVHCGKRIVATHGARPL
jgi:hypothetical protein